MTAARTSCMTWGSVDIYSILDISLTILSVLSIKFLANEPASNIVHQYAARHA